MTAVTTLVLTACASGEFQISQEDVQAAQEWAIFADAARAEAQGIRGTWLLYDYEAATCRWSRTQPDLAICRSPYVRSGNDRRVARQKYRRNADGNWRLVE